MAAEYTASGPFTKMLAASASDSVNLKQPARGILITSIAGGSDISFEAQTDGDTTITIEMVGVVVGTAIPCIVTRINSTGTTATLFVGY